MSVFEEKNITTITSLPDSQRRDLIAKMAPAEVLELSLRLPWAQRFRILEESPSFPEIINSYPIQELYWTIKAVGPRDSLSALRVLDPERIQFFFDLEWWQKDQFSPNRALSWMILLFEASENKVIEWTSHIHKVDEALLPLLFRSFIKVIKRPDDMEIQEARDVLAPFTLDDVYYIRFNNIELQPLWGRFLALLYAERPEIYRDLMEGILWETITEQLELAYKWRTSRLSDHGIPDYYNAIDIFAHMPSSLVRKIGEYEIDQLRKGDDLPISFVPTLYIENANTLISALSNLKGTPFMERIIHEWIGVANKIIVAEQIDIDEPNILLDALIEASSLINLGLECLVRETGDPPHEILKLAVLEDLVRLGVSVVKDARKPLYKFAQLPHVSEELFELPDGLRERVRAVLSEPPRIWDDIHYRSRPLVSITDIEGIKKDAQKVKDLVAIMERIEPHWSIWNKSISLEGTNFNDIQELDLLTGFVTALGNYVISGKAEVFPIEEELLPALFRRWDDGMYVETIVTEMVGPLDNGPSGPFLLMIKERIQTILEDWRSMGRPDTVDGLFLAGLLVRLKSDRA